MSLFPDTPKTLLDELALDGQLDEAKWQRFDELYRPVVAAFVVQRYPALADASDDIVQETMVRLVMTLRERKYAAGRARFRTYLGALVNNLAVDILRRRKRFANLLLDTVDWVSPQPTDAPMLALLDRQWQESCYKAARRHVLHHVPLPPHYADVWRALEKGDQPAAIAARLGVTPSFVRQVKHRVGTLISTTIATYGTS